jgi:DNA helicase-2/ATP-dependent DNA helicase PcrA
MEIQMELTRHGIPFEITSGMRFFEQAHVKDVAAFLKFAVNPRDELAFKRMVRLLTGIGARSAEQLWEQAAKAIHGLPRREELEGTASSVPAPVQGATGEAGPMTRPKAEAPFSFRDMLLR